MLLTIKYSGPTHTELSWLLHKRPDRIQEIPDLGFGRGEIFFTQAFGNGADGNAADSGATECALLLRVDPAWLRQRDIEAKRETGWLSPRGYACGSLLGTALDAAFSTALAGRCKAFPEAVGTVRRIEINAGPVPLGAGGQLPQAVLGPLGWKVETLPEPLDPDHPQRGPSEFGEFRATADLTLQAALRHLSALLPVLDGRRPRFVGDDDIERLRRIGDGWLDTHPARDMLVRRYLGGIREVWSRFPAPALAPRGDDVPQGALPEPVEAPPPTAQGSRIATALALLAEDRVRGVVAVDPSSRVLASLKRRMEHGFQQNRTGRVQVLQGAATYPMPELRDCDAAVLLEVIEHLEGWGLRALEEVIWGSGWRPRVTLITTPNRDFNAVFGMPPGRMRHADHRFEWSRDEFETWYGEVAARHGLDYQPFGAGAEMEGYGSVTQGVLLRAR